MAMLNRYRSAVRVPSRVTKFGRPPCVAFPVGRPPALTDGQQPHTDKPRQRLSVIDSGDHGGNLIGHHVRFLAVGRQ